MARRSLPGITETFAEAYGVGTRTAQEIALELCPGAISDDLTYYFAEHCIAVWGDRYMIATIDFSEVAE